MKEKLLISACLLGIPCRYDGKSKQAELPPELYEKYELIPVCPEIYGGLPTPRIPSERVGDRVLNARGEDVTAQYLRGAECAYAFCERFDCRIALLKERSPSCGKGRIYDGSFSGTLTDGDGVACEYLLERGVKVFGESEVDQLIKRNF